MDGILSNLTTDNQQRFTQLIRLVGRAGNKKNHYVFRCIYIMMLMKTDKLRELPALLRSIQNLTPEQFRDLSRVLKELP